MNIQSVGRTALLVVVLIGAVLIGGVEQASAKTCSDYENQAQAQANKDTIDADGDGLYCEGLPCPCSTDTGTPPPPSEETAPSRPKKTYTYKAVIIGVIDGDTLKVKIGRRTKTIRAIGIDTPESKKPGVPVECGALEATSAAYKWAFRKPRDQDGDGLYDAGRKGHRVRLKTDNTQNKTDRYGRLLVYITRGGKNFAKSLIRQGWGEVYVYNNNPFKQVDAFQVAEDAAKSASAGVWGKCNGDFHSEQ